MPSPRVEQLRVISLQRRSEGTSFAVSPNSFNLNVIFDRQSFAQPRTIDINLRDVTTAQALDYIFLQEGSVLSEAEPAHDSGCRSDSPSAVSATRSAHVLPLEHEPDDARTAGAAGDSAFSWPAADDRRADEAHEQFDCPRHG